MRLSAPGVARSADESVHMSVSILTRCVLRCDLPRCGCAPEDANDELVGAFAAEEVRKHNLSALRRLDEDGVGREDARDLLDVEDVRGVDELWTADSEGRGERWK